jgi:hypothetical protein
MIHATHVIASSISAAAIDTRTAAADIRVSANNDESRVRCIWRILFDLHVGLG